MADQGFRARQWTAAECLALNMIESHAGDGRSPHEGYACEWVAPYGWVPEADCPIHDGPAVTLSGPEMRIQRAETPNCPTGPEQPVTNRSL